MLRGTKQNIPMKANADQALFDTPSIEHVIVVRRTGEPVNMDAKRDVFGGMKQHQSQCKM